MNIKEIISKMTIEEKIGQLWQVPFSSDRLEEICKLASKGKIGSCILACTPLAGNTDGQELPFTEKLNLLQKEAVENSRMGIPLIYGRDVIHGQRTIYPIPLAQAATWAPDMVEEAAVRMVDEAKNDSVHWTFAPMIDIARDPRWGRIIEGFGEDVYLTTEMAKASVRGIQHKTQDGYVAMAACAKHYVGYGAVEGGREYSKGDFSDYTLRNVYIKPFEGAIEEDVMTVMSTFTSIGGEAIIASERLLKNLLKEELGFKGFVISDYDSVEQLVTRRMAKDKKDCAAIAFKSGVDMEMVTDCFVSALKELVEEGRIDESAIDDAVERILAVKEKVGLFEKPYTISNPSGQYKKEDLEYSLKIAEKSIVLLKNDNLLPLDKNMKVALCGPFSKEKRALHGSWAGYGDIPSTPTFEESMREEFGENIVYCENSFDIRKRDSAIVRSADVIVLALGESNIFSGENSCISDISLDSSQIEIAKKARMTGKKVAAVIFTGRPRSLYEIEPYVDAIILAWQPGSSGGKSAVNVLCGKTNPGGKLPVTMLKSSGQIPLYYSIDNNPCCISDPYYEEPEFSSYLDFSAMPMYPFGFGLSYSKFEISAPVCEKSQIRKEELLGGESVSIKIKVKNNSSISGDEVVQIYVKDCITTWCRPIRELKAFERVTLAGGECKEITLNLDKDAFNYYIPGKGNVIEEGEFIIFVGNSCLADKTVCINVV